MKGTSVFAILFILFSPVLNGLSWAHASEVEPLYFAPLPVSNPKLSFAKSLPLVKLIENTLNRPVIPKLYNDYHDIINGYVQGEIDFVELGPMVFLQLSKQTDHTFPLASINHEEGQRFYHCVLAAPIDGIKDIDQLKHNKTIKVALTQPLSTCGNLMTEHLLRQHGLELSELSYDYLGSHEKVAMALMRNEYQIGGLANFVAKRYHSFGLNTLSVSDSLPSFTIVGNPQKVSPDELRKLQQVLLNYRPQTGWGIGAHGFSPFSQSAFDTLKRIEAQSHTLPLSGDTP
ncbi:PhnD/SsuA/transferrin family substrate-binding protein [Thiomicrorhabdus sp. zzn3]|uniref:PhnD/SsuA/transferrin family substrate-binding protein n=1 Tax=Thiomicrorhabdus sp. zzn3 TaxID=3039775 RepID=UPI00243722F6|nr:PhnD/SsuA/transferrin family substrate-binding protein [Thiomicrorhabdus sp. zzn3]MDG6778526.1 PhnD/SsuA/transferrin family substrate-binding protein [Thiomicrorhabdus sp. zzn3]